MVRRSVIHAYKPRVKWHWKCDGQEKACLSRLLFEDYSRSGVAATVSAEAVKGETDGRRSNDADHMGKVSLSAEAPNGRAHALAG